MKIGDKIIFAQYKWRVLDMKNGKALLLCDKLLEDLQPYHKDFVDITWDSCTLRQYLNNDFLNEFHQVNRNKIVESLVLNVKNPWFSTCGGGNTTDYVFLLSLEEILQYFGNIGQLDDKSPNGLWSNAWKGDPYRTKRGAKMVNGNPKWWWLRSAGFRNNHAAYINGTGRVFVAGDRVVRTGGVRPALWIKLENFK